MAFWDVGATDVLGFGSGLLGGGGGGDPFGPSSDGHINIGQNPVITFGPFGNEPAENLVDSLIPQSLDTANMPQIALGGAAILLSLMVIGRAIGKGKTP